METNKGSMVENVSKQGCFNGYINEYKYVKKAVLFVSVYGFSYKVLGVYIISFNHFN